MERGLKVSVDWQFRPMRRREERLMELPMRRGERTEKPIKVDLHPGFPSDEEEGGAADGFVPWKICAGRGWKKSSKRGKGEIDRQKSGVVCSRYRGR